MELLLRKNAGGGFDAGDTVYVTNEDGHQWSPIEEDISIFTIIKNVPFSQSDKSRLIMPNEEFRNVSAISKIPAFRHSLFKSARMKVLHGKKYHYVNDKVELK